MATEQRHPPVVDNEMKKIPQSGNRTSPFGQGGLSEKALLNKEGGSEADG